jgi:hypothetical protein
MNKTSGHVKPCKIGQSEAHNKRAPEYIARINQKNLYVRTDLSPRNEEWISDTMEGNLQDYYNGLAKMVKEKTGRAMQTADRERVNKKTGKVTKISGSSPLREEVVVCDADTTMADLHRYIQACHDRWGITAIQVYLHRDEGHCETPGDLSTWKSNHHAHIVWDWMDHTTGKSYKLSAQDMSEMQDLLAESLRMERGRNKAETGFEHLERNDFIAAKQEQQIAEQQQRIIELDAANQKKTKFILDRTAKFFGFGEHENLESDYKALKESVEKEKAHVRQETAMQYEQKISDMTEKYRTLRGYYLRLQEAYQQSEGLLHLLAQLLYNASELFRRAVKVVIDYVKDIHRCCLTNEEVLTVKAAMDRHAVNGVSRQDVGKCIVQCADACTKLSTTECYRAEHQVMDVADGGYDDRLERYGIGR